MFAAAAVMVSELLVVEVVVKRQANPLYAGECVGVGKAVTSDS